MKNLKLLILASIATTTLGLASAAPSADQLLDDLESTKNAALAELTATRDDLQTSISSTDDQLRRDGQILVCVGALDQATPESQLSAEFTRTRTQILQDFLETKSEIEKLKLDLPVDRASLSAEITAKSGFYFSLISNFQNSIETFTDTLESEISAFKSANPELLVDLDQKMSQLQEITTDFAALQSEIFRFNNEFLPLESDITTIRQNLETAISSTRDASVRPALEREAQKFPEFTLYHELLHTRADDLKSQLLQNLRSEIATLTDDRFDSAAHDALTTKISDIHQQFFLDASDTQPDEINCPAVLAQDISLNGYLRSTQRDLARVHSKLQSGQEFFADSGAATQRKKEFSSLAQNFLDDELSDAIAEFSRARSELFSQASQTLTQQETQIAQRQNLATAPRDLTDFYSMRNEPANQEISKKLKNLSDQRGIFLDDTRIPDTDNIFVAALEQLRGRLGTPVANFKTAILNAVPRIESKIAASDSDSEKIKLEIVIEAIDFYAQNF